MVQRIQVQHTPSTIWIPSTKLIGRVSLAIMLAIKPVIRSLRAVVMLVLLNIPVMVIEDELLAPEVDDWEALCSFGWTACVLAFYVFPQRTSTSTSVPDLSTTQLAPGFIIAADVIKMIPNFTPFDHFGRKSLYFFKQWRDWRHFLIGVIALKTCDKWANKNKWNAIGT